MAAIGRRILIVAALSASVASCGGGAGGDDTPATTTYADPVVYSTAAADSLPSAAELSVVTHHQLVTGGNTLAYTATVGHLTARSLAADVPEASFFYVAYTLDGAPAAQRPVTFFYNGGPGSSTAWLHLGSFGPMRLVTGDPSTAAPSPFPLVANAQSLLDVTDMVFVDAVGSGYSEAIAPNTNESFWSVDNDAAVFRDFVIRYLAANTRQDSPKFLFGESYGTTRSAVLASLIESAGIALRGVVLQSSILNYNSNCAVGSSVNCAGFLPSYAATGAWYGLDNPNPAPADLPAFEDSVRTLSTTRYDPAITARQHGVPPSTALLASLVNVTGLPLSDWQVQFNMPPTTFHNNLIPGTVIGQYDARVSAPQGSPFGHGDPSSNFINGGFASGITAYLKSLNYTTPSSYVLLGNAIDSWNFRHGGLTLPDTIPDLATAMTLNPQLKVLSLNGYHDLVTPFYVTEMDLARLASDNVTTRFYVGGHMTYLDDGSQALEKADLAAFYADASGTH
ncbi:MAG: peptidase S10 [Casimicrobiaceae bacterium]